MSIFVAGHREAKRADILRLTGVRGARLTGVCFRVAPDICSQVDDWFCNDGHGLDDSGAIALAEALDRAIETDALKYEDALSGQPTDEDRFYQTALLEDGRRLCDVLPMPEGPWLINRLRDLVAFLRNSGGFKIW